MSASFAPPIQAGFKDAAVFQTALPHQPILTEHIDIAPCVKP
jgi:hypothetical protein